MVTKEHEEHQKAKHRALYNDWGVYAFVQMLHYKCVFAGKMLEYVDEHDSSKTCSRCGHHQPMPLWKRTYRCPNCGLVMDRDDNAAVNHLQRFLVRPGPHTADAARCAAGDRGGAAVTGAAQAGQAQ
jgi:putative transposase